ncbi:MAG: hypothetical protein JJE23_01665 [Thermoleophilia bacterium]|nr:hypothetical protein [Thermoleophilia bacterium]
MADPYAARPEDRAPAGERPAASASLRALVEQAGGVGVAGLEAAADLSSEAESAFTAVLVADDGLLPPLARVDPQLAVAILARAGDNARAARTAAEALAAASGPLLLLKEGVVAGPAGVSGCFEIEPDLIRSLLAAAVDGRIQWERDPDFGYELAAAAPGIEGTAADALCPRLLYAAADRVYEHADLVVTYKRRRHERLAAIEGVDPALLSASGWPIEPTGQAWKD